MNLFLFLSALFPWGIGISLGFHIITKWKHPEKQPHRWSEFIEVILFLFQGFQIWFLFDTNSPKERLFSQIFFLLVSLSFVLLYGLNVLPNIIKKRRNPHYRENSTYEDFLNRMNSKLKQQNWNTKQEIQKDLSRKFLHLLQFLGVIIFYMISIRHFPKEISNGISSSEFRNFFYLLVATLFWVLMMIGDMTRMQDWAYLPKWAWKWFEISLDLPKEAWTFNGATPILLANLLWINPVVPLPVFFTAVWVSCISDAAASAVGKHFGKHPLKIGKFPQKTWEGLIAGFSTTFFGVYVIMILLSSIPIASCIFVAVAISVLFAIIDLYGTLIGDNLLNSLFSGTLTWILIFFLG